MTLNEWIYFLAGIVWGVFIVTPLLNIAKKIWSEARQAQKEWRKHE